MLNGVAARARTIGDAARREAIDAACIRLRAAFPDLTVAAEDDAIVLSGPIPRGDARLRWIGRLLI